MAEIGKGNDDKLALGAIGGGTASVIGHGATGLVMKAVGVKCAGFGAAKAGAVIAMTNPVVGAACIVGGIGYLLYKSGKK